MLVRSRSARFAALALAFTTPLAAFFAAPAFANGNDDTEVSITLPLAAGVVQVHSTKDLSRTTVVLCNGSIVVIPSWPGGQKDGDVVVSGPVRAVFIHSGNNTTDAAETLLNSLVPGAVNGNSNSTGAIAYDVPCTSGDTGTGTGTGTGSGNDDENTNVESTDISDPGPVTTAGPTGETTVLGVTIVSDPPPAAPAPAPAAAVSPSVQKNNVAPEVASAELPRTGGGHFQFLMTLALSLLGAGIALRTAFGRRIRSASFPG